MWDTVNMQTQKVSKVPPFEGILNNFLAWGLEIHAKVKQ